MEIGEHVAAIAAAGARLADAASEAGLDAPVPTCPDWQVRDLVRHQGEVHRWATAIVRDGLSGNVDSADVVGLWPDDAELVPWFRDGCGALVAALESAAPDLECFTFLPAPSPLAFWARRQAHETGIHRVDAEGAIGAITPFPTAVAVDGIDELLGGFASRSRSRLRSAEPRALLVHAADADAAWHVAIGPERVAVTRLDTRDIGQPAAPEDVDELTPACAVSARASDLFVFLWNRLPRGAVDVAGDTTLLDLWRETMQIRWS